MPGKRRSILTILIGGGILVAIYLATTWLASSTPRAGVTQIIVTVEIVCNRASQPQIDHIQAGVEGEQASNSIGPTYAVKSGAHQNAWFVAAKIYGPGIETGEGPGVWIISGDPASPGLIASVNGAARAFSDFPTASATSFEATMQDKGAEQAEFCAK